MDQETTLFVGAHYEVTNPGSGQVVTQYYLAGTTRIAMRKYTIPQNMKVEYLLSDHLNSTSLTTDTSGAKVLELRYRIAPPKRSGGGKAWGEVRATWTANPTTTPAYKSPAYTYRVAPPKRSGGGTGQYSYMDDPTTSGVTEGFGLMFYNARWYDPALGRFAQADTVIPKEQGTQAWDRYTYVNNSPLAYKDPTGHTITQGDSGCTSKTDCAVVSQAVMRDLIKEGQIDEAVKLAVIYYRIDTHGASVEYDKDVELAIHDPGKITIGPQALRTPGVLGAVLFHESVHEEQYQAGRGYLWMDERSDAYREHGNAINEVEAYDREISELSRFDLSPEDLDFLGLDGNRASYYTKVSWNPILDQAITNGSYTLPDGLPDICVTDPRDSACYYFNPANSPSGE